MSPPLSATIFLAIALLATGNYASIATAAQEPFDYMDLKDGLLFMSLFPTGGAATNYLLAEATDTLLGLNESTAKLDSMLSQILERDSPDMRPSRDYKDFQDISLDVSKRAWYLLHEHAHRTINKKVDASLPLIRAVLQQAEVSAQCNEAVEITFSAAKQLDSWAIKLLSSWGSFPMSGLFEGTYGDVGSFHTCVEINQNKLIDHAHYCSLTFKPVLPARRDYELVVRKEPREILDMFEGKSPIVAKPVNHNQTQKIEDGEGAAYGKQQAQIWRKFGEHKHRHAFTDLLEHAQYHHYVYYKLGTCWPIQCSPFDVKRVAKLIGRRNILMHGPVKCYSKNATDYEQPDSVVVAGKHNASGNSQTLVGAAPPQQANGGKRLVISVWDLNEGIFIWKPHFSFAQQVAWYIILATTLFMVIMNLIDLFANRIPQVHSKLRRALVVDSTLKQAAVAAASNNGQQQAMTTILAESSSKPMVSFTMVATSEISTTTGEDDEKRQQDGEGFVVAERPVSWFMGVVDDCSVFTNARQFFRVSEGQMRNDILCLNGIRCITMIWIIMTHTMMYNDWSAFARTREVEKSLNSLVNQPLFNGSYLVDTFFLMSGLLSAFTAFRHCQGVRARFNSFAYIFGRWLRLTPQIFFVSLLYIVLPALSYGPHWYPVVGEHSENCIDNWWINVLHLQSFYRRDKMCNFVTWWISIDFFYHFLALAVIWIILIKGHRQGLILIASMVIGLIVWQSIRHYQLALPPNLLSTIPITGAMWTTMTLDFFFTPYTHVVPFFFGFYLGYLMALKKKLLVRQLNAKRSLISWCLSVGLLVGQSYSTFWWVTGKADYSRFSSTLFYGLCPIIWSGSLCWIIVACHCGYGGFINTFLGAKIFVILGKASYLVYLSHFLVLFFYYGNQSLLLEPTPVVMFYIIFGNIFISTIFGILLCIFYEMPWLKTHHRLMKYV